jgi:hypothetical protein
MIKRIDSLLMGLGLCLVLLGFNLSVAVAQPEIPDSLVNKRLQLLKTTLDKDKALTQRWWYGWLGAYSAATVAQGAIYFSSDNKSLKQDMALGAATTILGAAGQFISPLIPGNEPELLMALPENSSDERLKKMAYAEELLKQCATREKMALTWQNHILCTSVNLGGGLITWLGFKRTLWDGVVNFAINTVVTEAQIWSQPTFAKRKYKNYINNYLNTVKTYSYTPEVNWYLNAYPGGLGLKVVF